MLEKNPEISVIVPVYNVEKWLPKCLDSILGQTYGDFELILVNDGSTDGSLAICREYEAKDERVRVFSRSNHGAGATRNFGISKACGTWICFVDADDWIEEHYLMSFFSKKIAIKDRTMISQGILFDYSGMKENMPFFKYDDIEILTDNIEDISRYKILHNGCPVSKLYRANIVKINNLRFDEKLSIHEDHCFVLDYLKYIDSIVLSSSLSYHYMRYEQNNGHVSLTHRSHNAGVYLRASRLLHEKFMKLPIVNRHLNHPYIRSVMMKYGVRQLVNAYGVMDVTSGGDVMTDIKRQCRRVLDYMGQTGIHRLISHVIFVLPPRISAKLILFKRGMR